MYGTDNKNTVEEKKSCRHDGLCRENPNVKEKGEMKRKQYAEDRCMEILQFLMEYIYTHGYAPTLREIGKEICLASTSSVFAYLEKLEKEGFIKRDSTKPRTIQILMPGYAKTVGNTKLIPVTDSIQQMISEDSITEYLPVSKANLDKNGKYIAYRLKENNNRKMGFLRGDLLVIRVNSNDDSSTSGHRDARYSVYMSDGKVIIADQSRCNLLSSNKIGSIVSITREFCQAEPKMTK